MFGPKTRGASLAIEALRISSADFPRSAASVIRAGAFGEFQSVLFGLLGAEGVARVSEEEGYRFLADRAPGDQITRESGEAMSGAYGK